MNRNGTIDMNDMSGRYGGDPEMYQQAVRLFQSLGYTVSNRNLAPNPNG